VEYIKFDQKSKIMFKRTIKDTLIEKIRHEIVRGVYPPGYHLRLEHLADHFDISTMPIRTALQTLEHEGIVTTIPHRGTFVTRFTAAELEDIYEVRATLEKMAITSAVEHLTSDDIQQLKNIVAEWSHHTRDIAALVRINTDFHATLYAASGRTHLCDIIARLRYRTQHYLHAYRKIVPSMQAAHNDHQAIVQACEAGQVDEAARLTYNHVWTVGKLIAEYVRTQSDSDKTATE
jgi:DNA-binding GntR family transcriptional regulator